MKVYSVVAGGDSDVTAIDFMRSHEFRILPRIVIVKSRGKEFVIARCNVLEVKITCRVDSGHLVPGTIIPDAGKEQYDRLSKLGGTSGYTSGYAAEIIAYHNAKGLVEAAVHMQPAQQNILPSGSYRFDVGWR